MKRYREFVKGLTGVALVALAGCAQESEVTRQSAQREALRVVVEPIEMSSERTRLEAVGTSRAMRSIELHPAASGEVVEVDFKPGQFVEKGHVLLKLDQRDEALAVELAEVRLKEAERLYERYRNSAAAGATIPTTLDAAKAEVDAARIALNRAQIALDDRTIEAPFAGFVGITDVDPGDRIQPSTVVTTLDDRSSLLVSFEVPEVMIGKIDVGDSVSIATWSANATSAAGEVIEIDSRISPDTRTFITRARVDNDADRLRPGMSFRVLLDLDGDAYPVFSEVALQWGADGSYIWSVNEGKAMRIPVNIVQRQKGKVLVDANLDTSDVVVIEGIQRLRPGLSVQPDTTVAAKDMTGQPGPG